VSAPRAVSQIQDESFASALSRAAAGDSRSFDSLIRVTSPRLYRLAVRITGSFEDAEDVLQDAFVQAVSALRSSRFLHRASLETWLYRVVANGALRILRTRRHARAVAAEQPRAMESPARAEQRAELAILATWLEQLPHEQRAALVLKELEGLSTAEIASLLECTPGAVEQRLVRARATLRSRYGE
jgi:RNA polymerase sigma-70 factor (ECF subfamily)